MDTILIYAHSLFSSMLILFFILVSAFAGYGPMPLQAFQPNRHLPRVCLSSHDVVFSGSLPQDTSPRRKSLQFPTLASRGMTLTRALPLPGIAPLRDVMPACAPAWPADRQAHRQGETLAPRPVRSQPCTDAAAHQPESHSLRTVSPESTDRPARSAVRFHAPVRTASGRPGTVGPPATRVPYPRSLKVVLEGHVVKPAVETERSGSPREREHAFGVHDKISLAVNDRAAP